jgi:hypothetical protein
MKFSIDEIKEITFLKQKRKNEHFQKLKVLQSRNDFNGTAG